MSPAAEVLPPSFVWELHSRTLLFAKYALGLQIDERVYADRFLAARVALTGSEPILHTANGQYMATMATNLLARLCHNVTLVLPRGIPTQIAVPLLGDHEFRQDLLDLARRINPAAQVILAESVRNEFDAVLSIGSPPPNTHGGITINADGWVAYLSTEGSPFGWTTDNPNPLAAYAVACLGVSEVFKRIGSRIPGTIPFRTLPAGTLVFSVLDYAFSQAPFANPRPPSHIPLGELHFISMGALNSAALYAICSLPGVSGVIHIIEPERLDVSNLNRYLIATASAAVAREHKASHAAEVARRFLTIGRPEPVDYAGFRRAAGRAPIDIAVVGVDNDASRWAVQEDRPRVLLCGGTEVAQVTISRHDDPVGKACVGCLYPETLSQGQGMNSLAIPTVCFVSALAGILLAAEVVKCRLQALTAYRLDLALDVDLLAPSHAKSRKPGKSMTCGCHCWEFT